MAFDDDNFFDDYEIQELVDKFEFQLENDNISFYDIDELNMIIDYYVNKEDIEKINIVADLAMQLHSHSSGHVLNSIMAKKYLSVQDATNALRFLKDRDNNPDDPDLYVNLGYCYSLLYEHQKSINAYKKAIELFGKDCCPDVYTSLGLEYMLIRDYKKALIYLKKGLNGCLDTYEQYFEITNCYFNLDKSGEAIDFFKNEIDKNPHNIDAWMSLGNCYLRLHLLEKAVEQYEFALAIY